MDENAYNTPESNRRFRFTIRQILGLALLGSLALAVLLWRITGQVGLEQLRTIDTPVYGLRFVISGSSNKIAILGMRDTWICDSTTGKPLNSIKSSTERFLGFIAISHTANKVAIANGDGTPIMSNLTNGSALWSQQTTRLQFCDAQFFPSGARLAVSDGIWVSPGDYGAIRIYDSGTGDLQKTFDKLPQSPMGLAISPDERWLCARFNYIGQVFVWDLRDMTEIRRFGFCDKARGYLDDPSVTSLDISPDSNYVAVGGDGAFGVWRLATGEQLLAIEAVDESFVVHFHPTDPKLYVATSDSIQVWNQDGKRFVQKSATRVRLKDRRYVFAEDVPILGVVELGKKSLTLYRLPD